MLSKQRDHPFGDGLATVHRTARTSRAPMPGPDRYKRGSSSPIPRTVFVSGRRTSVRLEPVMWAGLHDIARRRELTLSDLLTEIDRRRNCPSFTAAIRAYLIDFYRNLAPT